MGERKQRLSVLELKNCFSLKTSKTNPKKRASSSSSHGRKKAKTLGFRIKNCGLLLKNGFKKTTRSQTKTDLERELIQRKVGKKGGKRISIGTSYRGRAGKKAGNKRNTILHIPS
jgi:hypothetical protein